jgi:hypothetical protein
VFFFSDRFADEFHHKTNRAKKILRIAHRILHRFIFCEHLSISFMPFFFGSPFGVLPAIMLDLVALTGPLTTEINQGLMPHKAGTNS